MQIDITLILTVCCSSQLVFCLGSVRSGCTDPQFDHKAARSTTGPYPTPAPSNGGRHTSESRAYCQVSLPSMCPRRHQSRSKLLVHQIYRMGACEMFRTLKCSTVSEKERLDLRPLLGLKEPAINPTTTLTISNPCSICRTN